MDPPLVDKDISNEEDKTVNATTEHVEDPFNDNDHRDIHLGFEGEVLGDPFKNVSTDNSESNIHKSAISDNLINGSDFCVISKSANILPETTDLSGNQKDIVKDQLDPVGGENQDNSEAEKRKLDNLSSKSETQGEIISTDNDTSSILNEVVSASTQNFGFVKSGNLHFCGNQNVSLVANHIRERTDKIILNNSLDVDSSNQSELAACSKDIEIPGEVECEPSCEVDKGKNIEEENDQDAIKATNDVRDIVSESNCVKKNDFGNPGYVGDDDIDMSVDENEEFNEENSTIISDGNNAINKFSNVDKNAIEGKDENHSEKQLVNKGLEDSEIGKCFMDIDNGRDSNRVEVETGESRDGSISNLDTGGTSTSKLDSLEYISLNSSHDIVGDMTRDEDDDSLLGSLSFNTLSDPFKDEETDDPLNDKGFRINKEKNSTVSADESFEVFESHSEEQTSKSNAIKLNKEPTNLDNISSGVKDQGKIKTSDPVIYSEVHSKTPETEVTSDNIRSIDHDHSRLQHDCHSPIAQHNDMILVKADMSVEKVKEPENLISVNRPNSRKDANLDSGMVTISEIQQANSECHLKDPSISLATEPENMVTNSMPRTIEGVVTNEEICKELVEKPVNAENTSSLNKLNTVEDIMTTEQIHENPENALATATEDKQTNFQSELEDSSSLMVTEKENVSISNELCVDDSSKESVVIAEETAGNLPKEPVNKDEHLSFESELQSSSSSEVTKQESHGSNSKSISIEHSGITKQIPGIVGEKTPTVNKQVNSLGVETEKVAKNNESFSMEGVVTTKEVCDNSVEKTVTNNEHKRKSSERNLEAPSSLLVAESENVAANNEPDSMDDVVITGEIRSSSKPCISKIISDKSEEDNDLTISDEKTGITRGNRLICIIHGDGLLDKLDDQKVAQCVQCKMDKNVLYTITDKIRDFSVCSQSCFAQFEKSQSTPHQIKKVNMTIIDKEPLPDLSSEVGTIPFCAGKCIPCGMDIKKESNFLSWEMMDFCSILCLETYEKQFERECMFCKASIKGDQLCKFRVRFGRELKQFCSSGCLDAYKPTVKICNYCQKDMKNNSAHSCIARIGDSQTFKDFCSVVCVIKYDDLLNLEDLGRDICTVCTKTSEIHAKIDFDERTHLLCSDPCISAFTFVNQIKAEICDTCSKLVDKEKDKPYSITELTEHKKVRYFCSQGCLNRYIMRKRAIVQCESCRVRKFNFDLIRMDINNEKKLFCSIRCLRTGINKFKGRLCEVCLNSASTTLVMDQKQQLLKVCILCREKHFSQPDLLSKNRILGHGSASRTKEQLSAQGGKNFASKEVRFNSKNDV
ncbi:hypothetical protein QYM36_012267 [Artemia franciscana]|uniref:TRASH domain-containing protein n=1 Tax=Artemia franciscana TaxID=6661 RepID=A0AA88HGS1_ARTSF|nr:hypothetical protein QYM36_012267 [Artemia franciscana]